MAGRKKTGVREGGALPAFLLGCLLTATMLRHDLYILIRRQKIAVQDALQLHVPSAAFCASAFFMHFHAASHFRRGGERIAWRRRRRQQQAFFTLMTLFSGHDACP
jgi:hypothetical protein